MFIRIFQNLSWVLMFPYLTIFFLYTAIKIDNCRNMLTLSCKNFKVGRQKTSKLFVIQSKTSCLSNRNHDTGRKPAVQCLKISFLLLFLCCGPIIA